MGNGPLSRPGRGAAEESARRALVAIAVAAAVLISAGRGLHAAEKTPPDEEPEHEVTLAPVEVIADATSSDQPVGPYKQPHWTTTPQRWATTRAYVRPPGVYEFEFFGVAELNDDARPAYEAPTELKLGLGHRIQLDLYSVHVRNEDQEHIHYNEENKVEIRYALADWGVLPLNPTLYAEWEHEVGKDSDAGEYKLLLADTLAPRLHWAGNLIYEQQYNHERETELGVTSAISYSLVDQVFSIGAEGEVVRETESGARDDPKWEILLGPSFEWRPSLNTSVRFIPLAGLGPDSPDAKVFLVFSYEFGPGVEDEGPGLPAPAEVR